VVLSSAPTPTSEAATLPPVLLVHGFQSSPGVFATMAERLRRNGRTVHAIDLPGQDNVANARAIAAFLAARRVHRVESSATAWAACRAAGS
jgi:triacylglycerol lipase